MGHKAHCQRGISKDSSGTRDQPPSQAHRFAARGRPKRRESASFLTQKAPWARLGLWGLRHFHLALASHNWGDLQSQLRTQSQLRGPAWWVRSAPPAKAMRKRTPKATVCPTGAPRRPWGGAWGCGFWSALAPHLGRRCAANLGTVSGVVFWVGVDFGQSYDHVLQILYLHYRAACAHF